jgi:Uma2 family endonuclease
MNSSVTDVQTADPPKGYPLSVGENEVFYPVESEGEMGETAAHYLLNSELFHVLRSFLKAQGNVVVAAKMMVYYDEGNPKHWLAPDIFVSFGTENKLRRVFKTWEEGVFPQVIFEIASDGTFENDLGGKRLDYARFGVEEYYLLDPEREYLPSPFDGFSSAAGAFTLD